MAQEQDQPNAGSVDVLTGGRRLLLQRANAMLHTLTRLHGIDCECELCRARMMTDCQDETSFSIPNVRYD